MLYWFTMHKIITSGILLGFGLVVAGGLPVNAALATSTTTTVTTTQSTATTTVITSTTTLQNQVAVEKRVREYFIEAPVMIAIARCESNFRQFTDSGSLFRGGMGGGMVGVFQFYEKFHTATARALGFDLSTLEGNIGYAKHVYVAEGTTPWISCVPATVPPVTLDAQTKLKIELMTKLVGLLQELLKLELAKK